MSSVTGGGKGYKRALEVRCSCTATPFESPGARDGPRTRDPQKGGAFEDGEADLLRMLSFFLDPVAVP